MQPGSADRLLTTTCQQVACPRCCTPRHPAAVHRPIQQHRLSIQCATAQEQATTSRNSREVQLGTRPTFTKPRVVVIGTGWGAISMVKALPKSISNMYDIAVISPRSYFLFTALLPAAAFGSVETRSIVEAARKLIEGKGTYYEAACTSIDTQKRIIQACFPSHAGLEKHCFQLPYDILVHCPGSCNNTFGISGVREHTFMFKSIEDAQALRQRVCECFERAALPGTSDKEMEKLLTFVVVGGGPTGVEVAAELHDVITEDLRRFYPQLVAQHAHVILVELSDHILSSYDRAIGEFASQAFQRSGIELVLNSRVNAIQKNRLTILCPDKSEKTIHFGACVWATGVAMHPLTKHLAGQLPDQDNFRSIICDQYLRVRGAGGSIYALGDAATIAQPRALEHAQELFDAADANKDGYLQLDELRSILRSASKQYSHLEEHARFLDKKYGGKRWGGFVLDKLGVGTQPSSIGTSSPVEALNFDSQPVSRQQFEELLETIDNGLRALPATGSVAGQEGHYLAGLLKSGAIQPDKPLPSTVEPFKYKLGNSVAYIGGSQAVMDVPSFGILTGKQAGVAWRGFEVYRQISFRNQCLVVGDWIKGKLFGRDVEFALAETEL